MCGIICICSNNQSKQDLLSTVSELPFTFKSVIFSIILASNF